MKLKMTAFIFLCCVLPLAAQDIGDFNYIDELASKKIATQGDAVKMFVITLGKNPATFNVNMRLLERENIIRGLKLSEKSPLRRGDLALMAARYLKLGDSLMFAVFKIRRYAFTACVANEIMDYSGGEWAVMSGGELIETMGRVSEKAGGAK